MIQKILTYALPALFIAAPISAQDSLPFSPVVEANGVLYLAGQIGWDSETRKFPKDIETQTHLTLKSIGKILEGENASFQDVVRCQVFLTDPKDFRKMNAIYRTYFPNNPPARSTVAVALAVPEAKIEIECTAVRGHGQKMQIQKTQIKEPK